MFLKKLMEIETNYDHHIVRAATSGRVTASHPNSEVKLPRVSVVLRWATTREGDMLHVPFFLKHPPPKADPPPSYWNGRAGSGECSENDLFCRLRNGSGM